ncbi:MAG: hypothetical protein ACRECO_12185 [Xanthobacteraceae bacterium]
MSGSVVVAAAGLLVGLFVFFVALPIALSSPYPTPRRQDWSAQPAPVAAATYQLSSANSVPVMPKRTTVVQESKQAQPEQKQELVPFKRVASLVIFRRDGASPPPAMATDASAPPSTAATPPLPAETVPTEEVEADPAVEAAKPEPKPKRDTGVMAEVDAYLWSVYQRQPTKKDRSGDFTWKDPAAAKRIGKTLQAYVIQGMDPDLREALYHAGKAMDAAAIEWTIVSAFRDDYRQSIAAGLKARTGYSRHGGSRATGGYGHGLAVDVAHVDGPSHHNEVWRWFDKNGMKYGLTRPIRHFDPPHVEPRGNWRKIARDMRKDRSGVAVALTDKPDEEAKPARKRARTARSHRRSGRSRRHR